MEEAFILRFFKKPNLGTVNLDDRGKTTMAKSLVRQIGSKQPLSST